MAVIFVGSTNLLSSSNTSRLIGPIIRWFKPDASPQLVQNVQLVVRKTGHLLEYAILAVLVCWALTAGRGGTMAGMLPRDGVTAFGISTLYAVTDEIHQSFVSTRQGSAVDVLIDSVGAAVGLILLRMLTRRRRRTNEEKCPSVAS